MYPLDFSTTVEETALSRSLCGNARPGHFRGVGTVVAKLFNIAQPDAALFGRKDFQQLSIIKRMVRDLNLRVKIIDAPTVREADGLAISSRNQYLTRAERAQAPAIRKALLSAKQNSARNPAALKKLVSRLLAKAPAARIDYVEVVDPVTLQPARKGARSSLIAVAVFFGKTRLIDNILLT